MVIGIINPSIEIFLIRGKTRFQHKTKSCKSIGLQDFDINKLFSFVGVAGFEPTTPRPPDVYANRTAPHPEWLQI